MQDPEAVPDAPHSLEAAYQEALQLIKQSRWTEAKRAIERVEAVDPTYKNAAKLRVMVEEVIQTSFYGFRLPPHLAAQQRPPAVQTASDEEPEDDLPPPRRTRWPLLLTGLIVLLMLVAIWMMFPR
ncbi:MAG: hypothetical protein RMM58_00600 [Chloroflexota bacterium]|nr:hypothetical protein [Dehalococcoidia bacterium]MDW8252357.1 hypothetical protein [Chloroflexota bacterium]